MKKRKRIRFILPAVILLLAAAFFIYVSVYYHADDAALAALQSDGAVKVVQTGTGILFDGPSETDALIFYPGGKVESRAYAPLLHLIAEEGMDVFLVDMPFNLAVFGGNRADKVTAEYDYENWHIGGHSLGGVMAASWASAHADSVETLILLASYPSKPLKGDFLTLTVWGSEDGVVNREKLQEGLAYAPAAHEECLIEGGNHAQFGSYGFQKGDGEAKITAEEQFRQTARFITEHAAD